MRKISILCIVALIACLLIGTVSAEVYSQSWSSSQYSHNEVSYIGAGGSSVSGWTQVEKIRFNGDLTDWEGCYYTAFMIDGNNVAQVGEHTSFDVYVKYNGLEYASGSAYLTAVHDELGGDIDTIFFRIYWNDFNVNSMISDGLSSSTLFDLEIKSIEGTNDFYVYRACSAITNVIQYGDDEYPFFYNSNGYYISYYADNTVTTITGIQQDWSSTVSCSSFSVNEVNEVILSSSLYTDWQITVDNSGYTYNDKLLGNAYLDILGGPIYVNVTDPVYDYTYQYIIGESGPESNTFTLNLAIEDASTGNLLSGASCLITNYNTSETIFNTEINGQKTFTLNRSLTYEINVSISGYHYFDGSPYAGEYLQFYGDDSVDLTMGMYPDTASNTSTVIFQCYESASYGGSAISGAAVLWDSTKQRTTNSNGRATFSDVDYGTYSYQITKDDYTTITGTVTVNEPEETIFVRMPREGSVATATVSGQPTATGTAVATADIRSYEEKADSALGILFDNVETVAALAMLIVIMSMIKWVGSAGNNPPRRRGRRK